MTAARAAGSLDTSGAVAAWLVGVAAWLGAGRHGYLLLVAFFALGTGATRMGRRTKTVRGLAEARGGARSARQVLANGAVPAVTAVLAACSPDSGRWLLAYCGSLAAAAADTVSSEIGQWLGTRTVRLTTLSPCRPGEDGGITLPGTAAGFGVAAVIALLAWAAGLVSMPQAPAVMIAGVAGGLFDSFLGDTLERRGWLDNEAVNFACTYAGALVAVGVG